MQVFVHGELVKTHGRGPTRGRCTDLGDYPPEKIAFFAADPDLVPQPGRRDRPGTSAKWSTRCWPVSALFRLRAAQGVLGLADKHGPQALEAACAAAIAAGDPSYRTVRGILALPAGTDTGPHVAGTQAGAGGGRDGATTSSTPAHLHGPADLLGHLPFVPDDDNHSHSSGDDNGDGAAAVDVAANLGAVSR